MLDPQTCQERCKTASAYQKTVFDKAQVRQNEQIIRDKKSQQGWEVKDNGKASLSAIPKDRK